MSYRLSSLRMGIAVLALALSGPWAGSVYAGGGERGRPIEFSQPKSDELSTNLHQLTSKKDSLKQLEEDLYKSVKRFSGGSSLDAVPAPPVNPPSGPVIPSKRVRDSLQRRKDLIFLRPEDLVPTPTAEEIFKVPEYGPDGREKKTKTAMELYYERLDAKRAAALKPTPSTADEPPGTLDVMSGRETSPQGADPALPAGLKEKEQALKKLFESEAADIPLPPAPVRRSSPSDIFGLGNNTPSPEKILEHKRLMEEFQSILAASRLPSPSADASGVFGAGPEPARPAASPFGGPDTSSAGNNELSAINPVFTPLGPRDVNAQVLGPPGLVPALPKAEAPKTATAPTFTAPRRPF